MSPSKPLNEWEQRSHDVRAMNKVSNARKRQHPLDSQRESEEKIHQPSKQSRATSTKDFLQCQDQATQTRSASATDKSDCVGNTGRVVRNQKAIGLVEYVTTMPAFNPVVRLQRITDETVDYITRFREYHSSDYELSSSPDQFSPPPSESDVGSRINTIDHTDISLDSDDVFETDGRQMQNSYSASHGPDLPIMNEAKRRVLESSMSMASGSEKQQSVDTSVISEEPVVHNSDSGLTPSATTVFDSGRSDDSGASTSRKLEHHLTTLDNMIADAQEPLHGPSCVCLKCIRILNVDGNDSPDFSSDDDLNEASAVFLSARQRTAAQDEAQSKAATDTNEQDESNIETQLIVADDRTEANSGLPFEPRAGCSRHAAIPHAQRNEAAVGGKPWCFKESKVKKVQRQALKSLQIAMDNDDGSDDSDNSIGQILRRIDERIPNVAEAVAREEAQDDELSSDSENELHASAKWPRVRRSWDSDSETTTDCDETDYSDEDDVRNFFVNFGNDDLERAKSNPITGHEQRPARRQNDTIDLDSSREEREMTYERELRDEWRPFLWVDNGPPETLPSNLEELLHFPNEDIIAEDPQLIFERLLVIGTHHHVPIVFLDKVWRLCQQIYEVFTGERPKGFYSLRQQVIDDLPGCTLHYTLQHRRTKAITHVKGKAFRRKRYPSRKYAPLICETRADLNELMAYHALLHQGTDRGDSLTEAVTEKHEIPLSFYVDGVSPSTTGSMKMICEVVRHNCCNLILSYNTVLYSKDYPITPDDLLQGLLADLRRYPHMKVELVICDLPERLRLCGHNHFNGAHGCLHCFAKGVKRQGAPGVVWPSSTMGEPLRDDQSFHELAAKTLELGCPVGGTKRFSPLLNIPNFSIVDCVAIEPMHLFAGLSRFFWENVAKKFFLKQQVNELTTSISEAYCELRFPSDFKRDRRTMDPPKWRCNEWKQFVALMGIDVGDYYHERGHRDAAALWYRYTWILRMAAQGDVWYRHGSRRGVGLRDQISILYRQVEDMLGVDKCIPNLHALYHLPDWRNKRPLSELSAEKAESFYGVVRRSFAEQGASIGKQVHVNTLIAAKRGHACQTVFKFKPKRQDDDMDHLLVDNTRRIYSYVGEDDDGEHYRVKKVHCIPFNDKHGLFNWRDCGVMRAVAESTVEQQLAKKRVIARAVVAADLKLFVWTKDLQEF